MDKVAEEGSFGKDVYTQVMAIVACGREQARREKQEQDPSLRVARGRGGPGVQEEGAAQNSQWP